MDNDDEKVEEKEERGCFFWESRMMVMMRISRKSLVCGFRRSNSIT